MAKKNTFGVQTCAEWPLWGCKAKRVNPNESNLVQFHITVGLIRNLRGEKLFEKLLSAQVWSPNLRGEKLFQKLLSAQVWVSPAHAKKESNDSQSLVRREVLMANGRSMMAQVAREVVGLA